jgi:chromosome segregation protein
MGDQQAGSQRLDSHTTTSTQPRPTPAPRGATWKCIDFHLHTPGVHSFALPAGTDARNPEHVKDIARQYADRLANAGIDIAVFTDYQGIRRDWFDEIKSHAAGRITCLPGAEVSIRQGGGKGLHLLLICSEDTNPDLVGEVIKHQGERSKALYEGRNEHTDLDLRDSLKDALRNIRQELDCAVIAAHARDKNGILRVLGAEQTAVLVHDGLLDAIDNCEDARDTLQGTAILSSDRLDRLSCTLSGDPKSLEEIGSKVTMEQHPRLTWIKLSSMTSAAIRLALHDPQTRVTTRKPATARHPRIVSARFQGGFLDGLDFAFNEDLTTLIGGRGSGKSAILEAIRYTLQAPIYSEAAERAELVGHALGSGGRATVVIERSGPTRNLQYEVSRVLGQEPRVRDLATGELVNSGPQGLFGPGGGPVILLQHEIQHVARDATFRRRLLDELIGQEVQEAERRITGAVEKLRQNDSILTEIESRLQRRREAVERIAKLDIEIAYFESQGVAEKLKRHADLEADRVSLEKMSQRTTEVITAQTTSREAVASRLKSIGTQLSDARSEHADRLRALAVAAGETGKVVDAAHEQIRLALVSLQGKLTELEGQWPGLTAGLDEDLRRIQRELGNDNLEAQRFVDAVNQREALQAELQGFGDLDTRKSDVERERRDLLSHLQDSRRQAFDLRRAAADGVNGRLSSALRMRVHYLGDRTEFKEDLVEQLKGSRVTNDAIDSICTTEATDGIEIVRQIDQGAQAVARRFQVTGTMSERLVAWLHDDPVKRRKLERMSPSDSVSIALMVDGIERDLDRLSGGQRATALLLLIFAQGNRPLVLDQPEDDLDNRFVYDDIVKLLRSEKGLSEPGRRRQIIAATHNANIPVNGDAELVLSLADESGRCTVRTKASIDDPAVRREIRSVLEGGKDAFRRRAQKYGGIVEEE